MKKIVKTFLDLPLEIGKTYKTKMQSGEMFTITDIKYRPLKADDVKIVSYVKGFFVYNPSNINCLLDPNRLIPERIEDGEIEVCSHCGTVI